MPAGSTGRYYLSGYVGYQPGTQWLLSGASFAQNGGIAEGVNGALEQVPVGASMTVLRFLSSSYGGEESLFLGAYSANVGGLFSDQKNIEHIQGRQGYASKYAFLGDGTTTVHDLVGLSEQVDCETGNARCSLFGRNLIVTLPAGTDGPSVGEEMQVVDNRSVGVPEYATWDNSGFYDFISSGISPLSAGLLFQGTTTGGAPGLYNGILFKDGSVSDVLFAERLFAAQNASGVSPSHQDRMRLDANGGALFQTLHIGGGLTTNDTYPTNGLAIDVNGNMSTPGDVTAATFHGKNIAATGDGNGAWQLGSSAASSGTTPYIDFLQGTSNGTSQYCRILGAGGANLDIFCNGSNDVIFYPGGAAFQVPPSMPALTVDGGKVALDAAGTVWVQETGGKVVIGTGGTNLFSVDTATGNVIAKGTVTQSGAP